MKINLGIASIITCGDVGRAHLLWLIEVAWVGRMWRLDIFGFRVAGHGISRPFSKELAKGWTRVLVETITEDDLLVMLVPAEVMADELTRAHVGRLVQHLRTDDGPIVLLLPPGWEIRVQRGGRKAQIEAVERKRAEFAARIGAQQSEPA